MTRKKKLLGLISQSNAEENEKTYIGYLWSERKAKKAKRKTAKNSRRKNRTKK